MGVVPKFLLRHVVTVEPYLGTWGSYGPGRPMRCFVAQKVKGTRNRYVTYTIVTRPDENCPDGSVITLADGTRGYAAVVTVNAGGGLPTPDNMEIAFQAAGTSFGPALGGETVVVLRRVPVGRDLHHNVLYTVDEVSVVGCSVTMTGSSEHDTGDRDQTVDTLDVLMPPDTSVKRSDRLRIRGLLYEVVGTPDDQVEPNTGAHPGVHVVARRVTG